MLDLTGDRVRRVVAALNVLAALGIAHFWYDFHYGSAFPVEELAPKIPHFEGYYAWETAFLVPDALLAVALATGGVRLWGRPRDALARTILTAASGAALFLAVLDLNYALRNGMYALGHPFSLVLASVPLQLIPLALGTIVLLALRPRREHGTPPGD
jgi:hypothetical protein